MWKKCSDFDDRYIKMITKHSLSGNKIYPKFGLNSIIDEILVRIIPRGEESMLADARMGEDMEGGSLWSQYSCWSSEMQKFLSN
jgi:hypothetical protein